MNTILKEGVIKVGQDLSTLESAEQYLARGWFVVPVRYGGKAPTAMGWPDLRATAADVKRWFSRTYPRNIGILCGEPSRLVVLDFDDCGAFEKWRIAHPGGAETLMVARDNAEPGRGHLYFGLADDQPAPKNVTGEGWDLLSDGKQVVAPPSVHKSGGVYRVTKNVQLLPWCDTYHPGGEEPGASAPMPRPPPPAGQVADGQPGGGLSAYVTAAVDNEREKVAQATEGGRNDALYKAAFALGQLMGGGSLPEHDATSALLEAARQCGLPDREAQVTIRSGLAAGAGEPRAIPDGQRLVAAQRAAGTGPPTGPPEPWRTPAALGGLGSPVAPWPWEAMPTPLRDMGLAVADTMNVPAAMAGATALGVASIALGNKARLEIKEDHRQFGNLYFLIAAPPAAGKTPCFGALQRPLVDCQLALRPAFEQDTRTWRVEEAMIKVEIRGVEDALRAAAKRPGADCEELKHRLAALHRRSSEAPPEPVLFCDDATSEALARRMSGNGDAVGVLSSDGRKVLHIARGRYVEGGDIDLWLKGHGGDYIRIDRRNAPSVELETPVLAAVVAVQNDALQSLGQEQALRESGFLARWLYVVPEFAAGDYPEKSIAPETRASYAAAIGRLLELRPADNDGRPVPIQVCFEPGAFELWTEFHNVTKRETVVQAETMPSLEKQWLSKLPEHVARLALLLHAVNSATRGVALSKVTREEVTSAAMIADCLRGHCKRALGVLGGDLVESRAKAVWAWAAKDRARLRDLRAGEGLGAIEAVKGRDLARFEVAGIKSAADAAPVLERLCVKGWLQEDFHQKGGAKAHTFHWLHPNPEGRQ